MWLYRQVCLYAAAPVVPCAPFAAAHVARAVQYALLTPLHASGLE